MVQIKIHHSDWRQIKNGLALIRGHIEWLEHNYNVSPDRLGLWEVSERAKEIRSWAFSIEKVLADGEFTDGVWGSLGPSEDGFDTLEDQEPF